MRSRLLFVTKVSSALAVAILIAWISYWAGFAKALQIAQYDNQLHDAAQAKEYDHLAEKLAAGKIDDVTSHMKTVSDILRQQITVSGNEHLSLMELLFPGPGISLVRYYNERRAGDAVDAQREKNGR
jgi:hypothetical protein